MYQNVFTTTIDAMLSSVSFTEILKKLWTIRKKLDTGNRKTGTPTDPTGSPEHRKNDLAEVRARSGAMTNPEDIDMIFECLLYCTV